MPPYRHICHLQCCHRMVTSCMTILSHFHHHLHHAPSPPLTFYNIGDGPTARFDHHRLCLLPRYHPMDTNEPMNGAPGTAKEGRCACHVRGNSATVSVHCRRPSFSNTSFAHQEPWCSQERTSNESRQSPCHIYGMGAGESETGQQGECPTTPFEILYAFSDL
jgi:hypothetical protein